MAHNFVLARITTVSILNSDIWKIVWSPVQLGHTSFGFLLGFGSLAIGECVLVLWSLGEDFGEVLGSGRGVLGDLFAAAEAVADDDGFGVVADGGEEDALS
jgi:hypothetical protein